MIVFDLQCDNGHVFEGWFENDDAFNSQKKKGQVECPCCGDSGVRKILSSFGIMKGSGTSENTAAKTDIKELKELSRKVVDFIEKNFQNVGADFAKEALKIHYGVSEPRNIRGVSTEKEEKVLKEEGIEVLKFPVPLEETDTDA